MQEIHNPALDEENRMDRAAIDEAYRRERALRECVSRGDREGARRQGGTLPLRRKMRERLPLNPLRAAKNGLVVLNTILRLSAEEGGLTPVMVHGISDDFARRIERMKGLDEADRLGGHMIDTYCEAVHRYSMSNHSRTVRAASDYILSHLDEKLSLASVSESIPVSPSSLARLFRREYGLTVGEYIREKKMEEARYLLTDTEDPLPAIAEKLGFDDSGYFIRTFRRSTGMTPGRYRNLNGSKSGPEPG